MNHRAELVLPGGDLERVKIAFLYGADAVYVGLSEYSLRKAEVRFTIPEIRKAIEHAHSLGKKLYVTFNIFAHDKHLETIEADLRKIASFGPDAFIVADPGILMLAKKVAPRVPIHLSTQANTINSASVLFWKDSGVKRVVLGREVTLDEIKTIKKTVPEMELEVFVHGAMCVSYSGRCLLSASLTGRSANLGECTQPCRWPYRLKEAPRYFLEEPTRPGELMEIQEDSSGTYIMNSKDLCLVGELDLLISAGVDALKVEGRNKTGYYLASVARCYREGLSLVESGKYKEGDKKRLLSELEKVTHRPYTTGFMFSKAHKGEVFEGRDPVYGNKFIGYILSESLTQKNSEVAVLVKNKIEVGQKYEVILPTEIKLVTCLGITSQAGGAVSVANPGRANETVLVVFDEKIPEMSFLREVS